LFNVLHIRLTSGCFSSPLLVEGAHFRAGEVCYLYYRSNDDYYEKRVSTGAVMKQAADRLSLPGIDGVAFFKRARMGDKVCLELLDCWMEELSRMFANLVVILDIEKIILGGGISSERELLLPRIRSAVDRRLPPGMRGQTCIEAALCANNAGMLGAVSLLLNAP
jgi:predicted NBD/HSP70 family sugar kinase